MLLALVVIVLLTSMETICDDEEVLDVLKKELVTMIQKNPKQRFL